MKQRNQISRKRKLLPRRKRLVVAVLSTLSIGASAVHAFPVGEEFLVNTFTTGSQIQPAVAISPDGDFVIVWEGVSEIFGQRFDSDGAPLGAEFQVNSFTTNTQVRPEIAMDSDGDFVVVWASVSQDGASYGIVGQRFLADGTKTGSEFIANSYTTSRQRIPDVAMDADGDFVVAWRSFRQVGNYDDVYAQRFDSSGARQGAEFRVNSYTTGVQADQTVAMDGDGNFVVVWESFQQDGSQTGIYGQRFDALGQALGGEFKVNGYTTGFQNDPDVAMDADGDFVIVWQGLDDFAVYGQRYNAQGQPQGTNFPISSVINNARETQVSMDADGDFVVVWAGYDNAANRYGIYGRRFNKFGIAQAEEFRANSFTTGDQRNQGVDLNSTGDFVVTWQGGSNQDSYGYGVLAQRYYANPAANDFNADRKSDLLWRNNVTGQNQEWLLDGNVNTPQGLPPVANNWQAVAVGDANPDGYADVIWRNQTDGRNLMWQLQNNTITKIVGLPRVADLNWQVQAMGDVNGDGAEDILWRHQTDGRNALWQLNDTIITSANLGTVSDMNWTVGGMGDGDGDGKADIFWRHQTDGRTALWLMDGINYSTGNLPTVGDSNWQVQGMGDTNEDGREDVVWRHQVDGRNVIWQLDGHNAPLSDFANQIPDTNWTMQQIGDTDGDRKADIVWRHQTDGRNVIWKMDGFNVITTGLPQVGNLDWDMEPDQ